MNKTLDWIKEIREGNQKVMKQDLEKVLKNFEGGQTEGNHSLLEELRDNEREDALLSLIQVMLEEEITPKHRNTEVKGK